MKSILQQISEKFKAQEKDAAAAIQVEIRNPNTSSQRRDFLKKTALGGIALGGFMGMSLEDTLAQTTSKVSRASSPADLKITDMRYAISFIKNEPVAKGSTSGQCAIIRIDTNQGVYGLGEVRDFWGPLVKTTDGRKLIEKGFANVLDMAPGLGVELNEEVFKQHLHLTDSSYFRPTPEWNEKRSHDRLWS